MSGFIGVVRPCELVPVVFKRAAVARVCNVLAFEVLVKDTWHMGF